MFGKRESLCLGLVCITFIGCAGEPALKVPDLAPVTGTVTMDGSPLAGAVLSFLPKGNTSGQVAMATTDASGHYALSYSNGMEGCPSGEYQVFISKLVTPDGNPIPEGQTAADVGAVDMIPARYRNMESPAGAIMIPEGGKSGVDFQLKSK